jgi:hypothetical protein
VNRVKQLFDLAMLMSHHGRRPVLDHTGFLFPHWKQQLFFPCDLPLEADLEFLERFLGSNTEFLLPLSVTINPFPGWGLF